MKHISITKKTWETNEQLSIISTLFKDVIMKCFLHNINRLTRNKKRIILYL